jgi:hypothetical protein
MSVMEGCCASSMTNRLSAVNVFVIGTTSRIFVDHE